MQIYSDEFVVKSWLGECLMKEIQWNDISFTKHDVKV